MRDSLSGRAAELAYLTDLMRTSLALPDAAIPLINEQLNGLAEMGIDNLELEGPRIYSRTAGWSPAFDAHRPIVNHLANHPRPDGYTRQVGATRDVHSLMRQHLRETAEKTAGLCPYPFPFQIWFDGDAVRARSASRRKRGGG